MSPSAQLALQDFVRYQGENGCTLYFEQFLKDGWSAWSADAKRRFAGLHIWQGVRAFTKSLRHVAAADDACRVHVASRTANLVRMATRVLFQNCRRVLLTDLTWPAYGRIALRQASRLSGKITWLRLRRFIMEHKAAPEEIASQIASVMQRRHCDGVFLPEVSHDGIRLPLHFLAKTFREQNLTPMTLVDGAQAFANVPIDQCLPTYDLYLAGSHKWLGAYLQDYLFHTDYPAFFAKIGHSRKEGFLSRLAHAAGEDRCFYDFVWLDPLPDDVTFLNLMREAEDAFKARHFE